MNASLPTRLLVLLIACSALCASPAEAGGNHATTAAANIRDWIQEHFQSYNTMVKKDILLKTAEKKRGWYTGWTQRKKNPIQYRWSPAKASQTREVAQSPWNRGWSL